MPHINRFISIPAYLAAFAIVGGLQIRPGFATLTIGNSPVAEDDDIFNQLTANGSDSLASEICSNMVASSETFTIGDVSKAQLHINVRKEIVSTINRMYGGGPIDFALPTTYAVYPSSGIIFQSTNPKATKPTLGMKVLPGVRTSDAVVEILNNPTRTGCEQAQIAAYLIAHRNIYGDAWINAKIPPGTLVIDVIHKFAVRSADGTTYIPGDIIFMTNKKDYKRKVELSPHYNPKKVYVWTGENTIYAGGGTTRTNGLFDGLGISPMSEAQLRARLKSGYETDTELPPLSDDDANANIKFNFFARVKIQP